MAIFADLPPQVQERVVCSIVAAVKYEIPANIVLAVAEKEGGKPGQWVRNTNGTHDVGLMQFNTAYVKELSRYGITVNDVAVAGCYAFDLAAWRLRRHLRNDSGDLWTRVANYHSRTPQYNTVYRADLMRKALKWANWLETDFVTLNVTTAGASPTMPSSRAIEAEQPHKVETAAVVSTAKPGTVQATSAMAYVPRTISFDRGSVHKTEKIMREADGVSGSTRLGPPK